MVVNAFRPSHRPAFLPVSTDPRYVLDADSGEVIPTTAEEQMVLLPASPDGRLVIARELASRTRGLPLVLVVPQEERIRPAFGILVQPGEQAVLDAAALTEDDTRQTDAALAFAEGEMLAQLMALVSCLDREELLAGWAYFRRLDGINPNVED